MGKNNSPNRTDVGDTVHKDEGCEIYARCLECPLSNCVFDLQPGSRQYQGFRTCAAMYLHIESANGVEDIQASTGVGERQAWRLLKRYKEADGDFSRFVLGDKGVL